MSLFRVYVDGALFYHHICLPGWNWGQGQDKERGPAVPQAGEQGAFK